MNEIKVVSMSWCGSCITRMWTLGGSIETLSFLNYRPVNKLLLYKYIEIRVCVCVRACPHKLLNELK